MITAEELQSLESTLLPALERHHLRLLAHGLRTLQAVAERRFGPLPPAEAVAAWTARQAPIAADPTFSAAFLSQMERLGDQLTQIALALGRSPLELELADLIHWARQSADARISPGRPHAPGPG